MFFRHEVDPKAAAAMRRAIILKYVYVKAFAAPPLDYIQSWSIDWTLEEKASFVAEFHRSFQPMIDNLTRAGLWPDVEESERLFLQAGIEEISEQQRVDASWLAESIGCLLWALGILPKIPPYDSETNPDSIKKLPAKPINELLRAAALRPSGEIQRERDLAELWHWRARTRGLQDEGRLQGKVTGGMTIEQIIEVAASVGAERGVLPRPIGSDFPALGRPYRDLSSDEFARMTSIAQERHKALNWLCGLSPTGRWADTPTNT